MTPEENSPQVRMTDDRNEKKWIGDFLVMDNFITSAVFVTQPPSNVRKSNFFNFTIKLLDGNHQPVVVESASFLAFCDSDESGNGVQYRVNLLLSDQKTRVHQRLVIRLVDSVTKELVRFDTSSTKVQSLELRRVLVTHDAICSRCMEGKLCGNKNETPSSPIIIETSQLKFFLKCNQNCATGPGNPRSSSRRFQLLVSLTEEVESVLCFSNNIFVHNNSKHTKTMGFVQSDLAVSKNTMKEPKILAIEPSQGWLMGGQTIVIIGDNFCHGLLVIFDSIPVPSQLLTSHAIRVQSPPRAFPGAVAVTLALDQRLYNCDTPGIFTYTASAQHSLDYGLARLARLVPRYTGDPPRLAREMVLERAALVAETFYSLPVCRGGETEEDREEDLLCS